MTVESRFNELAAYGTLISAGAVIPSVSALQQRLAIRLTEFSQCLIEAHHDTEQSLSLCRLLSYFLNQQLQHHQQYCTPQRDKYRMRTTGLCQQGLSRRNL